MRLPRRWSVTPAVVAASFAACGAILGRHGAAGRVSAVPGATPVVGLTSRSGAMTASATGVVRFADLIDDEPRAGLERALTTDTPSSVSVQAAVPPRRLLCASRNRARKPRSAQAQGSHGDGIEPIAWCQNTTPQ